MTNITVQKAQKESRHFWEEDGGSINNSPDSGGEEGRGGKGGRRKSWENHVLCLVGTQWLSLWFCKWRLDERNLPHQAPDAHKEH